MLRRTCAVVVTTSTPTDPAPVADLPAPGDETVVIDNARRTFEAARHPTSLVALDGAARLLTRVADSCWVADLVASWAAKSPVRAVGPD